MALQVKIKVKETEDRLALYVFDITKYYSVINTGGYGEGNPSFKVEGLTTVLTSSVSIVTPGGTTYTFDTSADFPTLDIDSAYKINNTDLGLTVTDKLPDGIYNVQYTVSGTYNAVAFSSDTSYDVLIKGQAQDRVDGKLNSIEVSEDDCGCNGNDEVLEQAKLEHILRAASHAASCAKSKRAKVLLDYVNDNCDSNSCKTC